MTGRISHPSHVSIQLQRYFFVTTRERDQTVEGLSG